jgi:hypothetical protein
MDTSVDIQRFQIIAVIASLGLLLFILELVRRGKLRERYALLWLASALVGCVFSFWRDLLDRTAHAVGIAYAPALLFLIAIFFGMMILLHFSIVISSLSDKVKTLAQEVAILKSKDGKERQKGEAT